MFFNTLNTFGKNVAVLDEQLNPLSYDGLSEKVESLIKKLNGKSGLVFNLCENDVSSVVSYLALLKTPDLKQLLLSPQIDPAQLSHLIEAYHPNYIFLPKDSSLKLTGFTRMLEADSLVIVECDHQYKHTFHKNLALLLPTSGSTGSPKLVRISFQTLDSNARAIAEYLDINDQCRAITTLPMNYAFGLSILNSHLAMGASIVLNNFGITEKPFWALLKESKATTFSGVPFTFELLKRLKFERMDLPHLKQITQAGGKLRSELVKEFSSICESKQQQFYVMYGQTEATARMSYLPYEQCLQRPGSIGIPIPGGKFLLYTDEGQLIEEEGVVGELTYIGDNVTMGYALHPDNFAQGDERKGVLKTGDLAKRDHEGYYEIVGRKSRFIKICGSRYGLEDIENIYSRQGISVACSGEDDSLMIFYTDPEKSEVIEEVFFKQLGIHPRYATTTLIKEIPRNETGKVNYKKLSELAQERDRS